MKILVVGYGSIGRVHATNAASHGTVGVCDASPDARDAAASGGIEEAFETLESALAWKPDGVVVATPPDTHLSLARAVLDAGAAVMIEKPVAHDLSDIAPFRDPRLPAYVVCNMRFHPAVAEMTERFGEIGSPLFARAHYGHYLPQMRPGTDYRTLYAAQQAAGGGVVRDAIHEIDYLMAWLGPVAEVRCTAGRLSDLEIDVEDFAVITLEHQSGAMSEIHLDYLRRRKARGCELCGTDASLIWESDGKAPEHCWLSRVRDNDGPPEVLLNEPDLDAAVMYRRLMDEFAAAIGGRPSALATIDDGADALAVALAALESAAQGRGIALAKEVA